MTERSASAPSDPRFPGVEHLDDYRFVRHLTTRWADNDHYGHINNVHYYAYVDTVVNAYLIERCGVDIRKLAQVGLVVESGCRYHRALSYPQDVTVGLRVARLGRSSVTYHAGVASPDGRVAAEVYFVHAYVDRDTRRSAEVPDEIRTAVAPLVAQPSPGS